MFRKLLSLVSFRSTLDVATDTDVQVYPICLTREARGSSKLNSNLPERSSNFLLKLAKETGGQAFIPKSVAELPEVVSQLTAILHTQYVIEYKPDKPAPGQSYRTSAPRPSGVKPSMRSEYFLP